jgi:hypothetical protein
MPVHHQYVLAAIVIDVWEMNYSPEKLRARTQPGFIVLVRESTVAIIVIKIGRIVAKICLGKVEVAILASVPSRNWVCQARFSSASWQVPLIDSRSTLSLSLTDF